RWLAGEEGAGRADWRASGREVARRRGGRLKWRAPGGEEGGRNGQYGAGGWPDEVSAGDASI
ncbi:hypothetical protein E2562_027941, partial [Oryza meyeriana var. granulata]